ncbi:MAG: poly-gamma-glutamate system protein [Spirochaetaceae bacterium]|nr:poly-gamma-glutamate system protein [Spirochaetaceae bacterium]
MNTRATTLRVMLALVSLLGGILLARALVRSEEHPAASVMQAAALRLQRAEQAIAQARREQGFPPDQESDPFSTGMIGLPSSPLTTTSGDIVAKRTSTHRAFAALTVRWFHELGLHPGDRIAIGASGSFPALLLAVLSACAETGIEPVVIPSIGASSYGANIPGYTNAEMLELLYRKGLLPFRAAALSPGGEGDRGVSAYFSLEPRTDLYEYALSLASRLGVRCIDEPDAAANRAQRLAIYSQGAPIRLFVNIGGADPNFGNDAVSLRIRPGLVMPSAYSEKATGGLLGYFLGRGIPALHLLDIKSLALAHGIPVDGNPWGEIPPQILYFSRMPRWPLLAGLMLAAFALVAGWRREQS